MPKRNKSTETDVITPEIIEGYNKVVGEVKALRQDIINLKDAYRSKQKNIEEIKRELLLCDERYRQRQHYLNEHKKNASKREQTLSVDSGNYQDAIERKTTKMSSVKQEIERLEGAIFTRTCIGIFVILVLIWYKISNRFFRVPNILHRSDGKILNVLNSTMSKREYRTVEDDIIPKYMRALNDKFKLRSEVTILKLDVPKQQYLIDKFTVQLEEKKRLLEELEGEIANVHGEVEQIEKARSKNLSKFDNSLKGVEDVEIALVEQARQLRHTLKIRTYITSVLIVILIFFALR